MMTLVSRTAVLRRADIPHGLVVLARPLLHKSHLGSKHEDQVDERVCG